MIKIIIVILMKEFLLMEIQIFFFNGKLIDNIFSSKKIDEAEFEISILNKTINFIEYKEVTLTNPNKDFYLDSISKIYINYTDNEEQLIEYNRNENEDNLISISDDYKSLFFDLKYDFGYSYYLIQLQRKLFPDENFENSISINGSNFKDNNNILINYNLDEIIFSPNYVIIGYINLKLEYSTTNLIFKNEEAFKLYGNAFCSNFQNPMNLNQQFNLIVLKIMIINHIKLFLQYLNLEF